MEYHTNIQDIDFDGASISKIEKNDSELTIVFIGCTLLKSHPAATNGIVSGQPIKIVFYSISEEVACMYKGQGVVEENNHQPPLDRVETFNCLNGLFEFGGYISNEPWAVWQFKASSYVTSW